MKKTEQYIDGHIYTMHIADNQMQEDTNPKLWAEVSRVDKPSKQTIEVFNDLHQFFNEIVEGHEIHLKDEWLERGIIENVKVTVIVECNYTEDYTKDPKKYQTE